MSAFFRLVGADALLSALEEAIDAAKSPQEYWVGSNVEYGPFHEFGTVRMAARPHWRPAITHVAREFEMSVDHDEAINQLVLRDRGLVRLIAFKLEREVKLLIRAKHIIDTSNYFGSIAAAPTMQEAARLSASRRID